MNRQDQNTPADSLPESPTLSPINRLGKAFNNQDEFEFLEAVLDIGGAMHCAGSEYLATESRRVADQLQREHEERTVDGKWKELFSQKHTLIYLPFCNGVVRMRITIDQKKGEVVCTMVDSGWPRHSDKIKLWESWGGVPSQAGMVSDQITISLEKKEQELGLEKGDAISQRQNITWVSIFRALRWWR